MSKNNYKDGLSEREALIYKTWEESGAFTSNADFSVSPYTIMLPPPNVTGNLHVGHALTVTLQDILIRWKKMQGNNTLWQPGTDHAGIATQMIVNQQLSKQNLSSQDLGRDRFIEEIWKWKSHSGGNITQQLRRLGGSLDWNRERFTLDNDYSFAVNEAFITLYNQGYIYRDRRLVNWDPKIKSAVSDLEVKNVELKGSMFYIRYPIVDRQNSFITIATTRPETMLGDVAIAVHPSDEQYNKLIGLHVFVPLVGRIIPIIGDAYCKPEEGTGAIKVTPAHDFNDFAIAQKHTLSMPSIFDIQAHISIDEIKDDLQTIAGVSSIEFVHNLQGKTSSKAREEIIQELKKINLLEKVEAHTLKVPISERSNAIIEPRLTTQWFCDAATLAKAGIDAVERGEIKFIPKTWENTYFSWMADIQPWCISRQIWWGHRIPAWYGKDGKIFVGTAESALIAAKEFYQDDDVKLIQDEDVLDTWFSSALWPFVSLGWPKRSIDLEYYYPTDVLVTGHDIIFFWISRMIMMGLHFMKKVPFNTVFIHGLILDEHGQKMSKTKGNVIDPLEVMDKFGTDSLRWTLCSITGSGRNLKLYNSQIETSSSFITKLYNAAIFCEINSIIPNAKFDPKNVQNPLCLWILAKTNIIVEEATEALEAFRFNEYSERLYNFIWHTFCDWFIELIKHELVGNDSTEVRETAAYVFGTILCLLHPVMPFITEEIWNRLGYGSLGSLMHHKWPKILQVNNIEETLKEVDWITRLITSIRVLRAEMNIPYSVRIQIFLDDASNKNFELMMRWSKAIKQITRADEISLLNGQTAPIGSVQILIDQMTIFIKADIITTSERERIEKEIYKATNKLDHLNLQLKNNQFINGAPINIVEEKRQHVRELTLQIEHLKAALEK